MGLFERLLSAIEQARRFTQLSRCYKLGARETRPSSGGQLRLARGIRSGQVFVNDYGAAGGIELPFGGVGRSGHGREKGFEGLKSYSRIKTVAIRHG